MKTVIYRPQANRTERVNRDLVQKIANYVSEQHDTWDQFLREFAYAIRTAVRIYRHRKCDETEIGTGNSDNGSLRDESSGFDRAQRRSNDSRDGKKKGYKRANESRSGRPERKVQKESEHRVNKRVLSSNYRTNHSLTKFRKKSRKEETVTPTTSGYNLRRRIGKREESRPTIERKTQQGGPSRSRKGRERNDSPTLRSEQDQATRMPDEEVINNGKTKKGEERGQRNPCR
ncbi:uncharacterized protein TNCV_3078211 [Trichonephila clavipes]|nr:uncharacterized protein TNCV_3078211 [Trichonephila clavipes]